MSKVKELKNKIAELQEELSLLEDRDMFVSPKVNIPKSIENAIAWLCIAKNEDIFVVGEKNYIAYSLNNEDTFCGVLLEEHDVEANVYDFGVEYADIFSNNKLEKFCCKFSPEKNETYIVSFLKVKKSNCGNIIVEDIQ